MRMFLKRKSKNASPSISDLPNSPAVYALYGGKHPRRYVAYVGMTKSLRKAITQYFATRYEGITSEAPAGLLNRDQITGIRWWTRSDFSDTSVREAAKVIALDLLTPAQRSRASVSKCATLLCKDSQFRRKLRTLFKGPATGYLKILDLQDALEKIADIEKTHARTREDAFERIRELEKSVETLRSLVDDLS